MDSASNKGQVGAEYQGTLEGVWRSRPTEKRGLLGCYLPHVLADTLERRNPYFEAVRNSELRALSGQEYVDRYAKRKDVVEVVEPARIGTLPADVGGARVPARA